MVDYIMETVPFEEITQWGRGSSLLHVYTHNRYLGHATLLLRDPNKGCGTRRRMDQRHVEVMSFIP